MRRSISTVDLTWLESVTLTSGAHDSPEDGVCALEAAAYLAGEPHSDHPQCVCPVIATFMRSWNDSLRSDDERDRLLKPLLPRVLNTRSTPEVEHRRSLMALDWLIRTHTAAWLDLIGSLRPHAEALRALPEVTDDTAATAGLVVRSARYAAWNAGASAWAVWNAGASAWAAWDAAEVAAWDAAWASAGTAAGTAAGVAAGVAAEVAAGDAAGYAAWDAAMAAAGKNLHGTVEHLQQSAVSLVEAMAAVQHESQSLGAAPQQTGGGVATSHPAAPSPVTDRGNGVADSSSGCGSVAAESQPKGGEQ